MNCFELMKLAENGSISARIELARILTENGIDDADNARKIVAWIQELSDNENTDAQYYVATMHRLAEHPMDAFVLYSKAALKNHPLASIWLAKYYFYGWVIEKKLDVAFNLASKAFELGEKTYAPQLLAYFYLSGEVVSTNVLEAHKLLTISYSNGNNDVLETLDKIEMAYPNLHH